MASVTYYVALPFVRDEEHTLVPGEAQERQSRQAAIAAARMLAKTAAGAVAFCRSGDPDTGDFQDAELLEKFGDVPDDRSTL
jgi:hypothetical protein